MNAVILSNALDTNGQNARYARASEKWGTDAGVLKALAIGHYDPAGVVGRFQAAADKFGELKIRSVHRAQHIYQQMPADIIWTRRNSPEIRRLAEAADVIHLNNSTVAYRRLRLRRDKPVLLHHHGSLFRDNPNYLLQEARNYGALQAVSTVDLMRPAPEYLHWLPSAYDIDALVELGDAHRREPDDRIRVVQCPTDGVNGRYKSTAALEAAVAQLQAEGLPLELVVVRGKPWAEAMELKASADIYFDQVILGYGCNAIEAWGMGIPVIAGADEWTLAKMREVFGSTTLPFYTATVDTIADAIRDLAGSKAKRTTWAKRGMAHVRTFHDERPALTRLAELYRRSYDEPYDGPVNQTTEPVTFRADVPQVRIGKWITFVDGQYTTDNLHVIAKLRRIAQKNPSYGIEVVA